MSLHVTGKLLGIVTENVHSDTGAFADFVSTTVHLLDGVKTDEVRLGRDFDKRTLAEVREGDLLDLKVFLSKGRMYAEKIEQHVPAAVPAKG